MIFSSALDRRFQRVEMSFGKIIPVQKKELIEVVIFVATSFVISPAGHRDGIIRLRVGMG